MKEVRAAIVMISRVDGSIKLTDGVGREHDIQSDQDLRETIDRILDDPEVPQMEQVARLETAAEQIVAQAAASFLPETAKSLAGPLVRDLIGAVRRMAENSAARRGERPPKEPPTQRNAEARAARMTRSQFRIGHSVKRRGNAA